MENHHFLKDFIAAIALFVGNFKKLIKYVIYVTFNYIYILLNTKIMAMLFF